MKTKIILLIIIIGLIFLNGCVNEPIEESVYNKLCPENKGFIFRDQECECKGLCNQNKLEFYGYSHDVCFCIGKEEEIKSFPI